MNLDSGMAPYRPAPLDKREINLDTPTIICKTCRYVRLYFDQKQRNKNGVLIPLEVRTGIKHDCLHSEPKQCACGALIYFDDKVLSATGKKVPLNYQDDCYHFCNYRKGAIKA